MKHKFVSMLRFIWHCILVMFMTVCIVGMTFLVIYAFTKYDVLEDLSALRMLGG